MDAPCHPRLGCWRGEDCLIRRRAARRPVFEDWVLLASGLPARRHCTETLSLRQLAALAIHADPAEWEELRPKCASLWVGDALAPKNGARPWTPDPSWAEIIYPPATYPGQPSPWASAPSSWAERADPPPGEKGPGQPSPWAPAPSSSWAERADPPLGEKGPGQLSPWAPAWAPTWASLPGLAPSWAERADPPPEEKNPGQLSPWVPAEPGLPRSWAEEGGPPAPGASGEKGPAARRDPWACLGAEGAPPPARRPTGGGGHTEPPEDWLWSPMEA
jgi:hypothetical protein